MSVVGPRPERVEHVRKYTEEIPEFKFREKVKAATGYAQVYGKYNTTPYDKLKLDLMYIQSYSILLDLEILCKTIKTLFEKESTEGFAEQEECGSIPKKSGIRRKITETAGHNTKQLIYAAFALLMYLLFAGIYPA